MKDYFFILKDHILHTYSVKTLLERIARMRTFSVHEDKKIDINEDKYGLISEIQSAIEKIRRISTPGTERNLEKYSEDVEMNDSFASSVIDTMGQAFEYILSDLSSGRKNIALEKIVLFIQLYGSTCGNPLIVMKNYKLVNGAWRNGSVEGYPVILMLDSLRRTYSVSGKKLRKLFARTCTHHIRLAEISYDALQAGNTDIAESTFSVLLDDIFYDEKVKREWHGAYKAVATLFNKDNGNIPAAGFADFEDSDRKNEKIIVSGMGWSGSGAVFAYLKEFQEIRHIDTEIQHITGAVSTKTLRASAKEGELFRKKFLRFFGLGLFGFAEYENYQQYRTLINANQFSVSENGKKYAEGARCFCEDIVRAYDGNDLNRELYIKAVDNLLYAIAESDSPIQGKKLLFDNIIKMHELDELDYLINARIIPVYRDPRSNYVALCRESVKFNPSVHQYILYYRNRRVKTEKKFLAMKKKEYVKFIQFEDFVTDPGCRRDVAGWLGLDLTRQEEFSSFKPWISEKNVLNYTDFEDQKAIRTIEKELPEYLWRKKN